MSGARPRTQRTGTTRVLGALTSTALVAAGLTAGLLLPAAGPALADTAPLDPNTPATVSADALPTVQINGVVWSQATVGNTVYATGSFTSARPAGSAAGSNETPRANLLAYDITTGNLITSFNHTLDAQGLVVRASPDGTRVYVAGDFTKVDGVTHNHIAAFNTSTGKLLTNFNANFNSKTRALAVTNSTVYAGGNFTAASGATRTRLAAVDAKTGALLAWAPTADDANVQAMVITPDGYKVVVGGDFTTLSGTAAYGMGALDASTGSVQPWAANQLVRDAGANAAIDSLRTDGKQIYGTGYVFGAGGNTEGTFTADPSTGAVNWVADCHGDSYDTAVIGGAVYTVSHSHFCGNIGAFPETNPRTFHRATAYTTNATQTISHNSTGSYYDFFGTPAPTQLDWYPTLDSGTYTGQNQGAWSETTNGTYLALGGEFPRVNSAAQQGLVRFAVASSAPNKTPPRPSSTLTPTLSSQSPGTVRVGWQATWDQDNESLTYKVVRDGKTASPVYTVAANSRFYNLPVLGFTDTGLAPGSTHTYRVYAYDAYNNVNSGSSASVAVTSTAPPQYTSDVLADGATSYWRLGEPSGTKGVDWAGYDDLIEGTGVGHGAAGVVGDGSTASTFDGTTTGTAATSAVLDAPPVFSIEAWVNTTSTKGGKIVGFGNAATGNSSAYDRQVYMDNSGHILFGVYYNGTRTVSGPTAYNDGQWHHVVASQSSSGMVLYVDGIRTGRDAGTTLNTPNHGYWRVGGDNLGGWPSAPTSNTLAGSIDEVAIYPTALSVTQVRQHYTDTGRTPNVPPAPTDSYGSTVYADGPDLYWRLDDTSGPTAADASGNSTPGTYSGGVSYRQPTPVTASPGTGAALDGSNGLIASSALVNNPSVYSEELWFSTTTTRGGKLIGFGNATSGNSSNYDRHVWMLNSGQLVFGTYTGQLNLAQSSAAYNDGHWHHLVAAQGADGMHLYVDGTQVASNAQTSAQSFSGYWRVGGDNLNGWGSGFSSAYIAASVDEVAVYSSELSAAAVRAHYRSSPAAVDLPPTASFTSSCTDATCTFDASGSSDPDGTVARSDWDYGDGTTGTGSPAQHSFPASGTYTVRLTVTDDQGSTGTSSASVTVTRPANQPPVAGSSVVFSGLTGAFDGRSSSDPDGSIASYAWTFGDGATATGATTSHTYPAAGDYSVTITVTDDQNATATRTTTVSPQPAANPASGTFARDAFGRTTSGGLGSADVGGGWSTSGTAANLSVSGGAASFALPSTGTLINAYLGAQQQTDSDTTVTVTSDKPGTGSGVLAYVVGRRVAFNSEYRARVRLNGKNVQVALSRLAGSSTETLIQPDVAVPGITYAAGVQVKVRLLVTGSGPTTLRVKVWPATGTEPAAWTSTATDSTSALQARGSVALGGYLTSSATNAPVTLLYSAFNAATSPSPVAAFATPACSGLACTVDGSTSGDSTGPPSSWQWSWGDGQVTTGATSSHTYGTGGTYRITLTVTNASGRTAVTTQTVTLPA